MSRPPPTDNDPISEPDLGVYTPKYPNGNRGRLLVEVAPGEGDTDALLAPNQKLRSVVPWGLRTIDRYQSCPAFQFMTTARFWRCVEGAFRTAVIGMLPPAVVLYSTYDNNNGPWKSQSIMLVGAMLGVLGKETIGLQVQYIGTFMRASIIWVPIITIAAAIELYFHMVAIFIVYGVCIFLIGAFTEGFSRRVAMLFLTMVYMDMLRSHPPTEKSRRYFDLWLEILIGTGFACLCAVFPWPALSSHKADEALDTLSSNISIALQGLTSSFWTDSSLTRNVQMVRVRFVMHSIEANIGEVKKHLVGAEHEWMFQSSERRSLRLLKTSLYAKLFRNLSSIRRVVDIVRERPAILSHSERAILFGDRLCKRIDAICVAVDELLYHLNMAKSNDELLKTGIYFDNVANLHKEMQNEFHAARREFFYESRLDTLEEFVPLMTFYMFCVAQICTTLAKVRETSRHELRLREEQGPTGRVVQFLKYAWEYFTSPIKVSFEHAKHIIIRRNRNDNRYTIEAVKVSAAMVASLVFYYYTDNANAFLSGPTITAFIAGQNPAEAVVFSVPRLSGTLMGIVVGFFIANNAETSVARIAGLITFLFLCRMSADVKYIGGALTFAGFISISQLSVIPLSQSATMSRIQQTTFAVFIYVVITMFVLPCRPTTLLREAHSAVILRISRAYQSIMQTFLETGDVYAACDHHHNNDEGEEGNNSLSRNGSMALGGTFAAAGGSFAVNLLEYPKEKFEDIDKQLKEIDKFLLEAQGLIPFAVDEPRLTTAPFPLRASEDTQASLKKIVALLRTMGESMRLLRARRSPASPEMVSLLRNVVPCARDTTFELEQLTLLISTLIVDRRVDLGAELSKSSQSFSHMCSIFHRRKSAIFLQVIRRAVTAVGPTISLGSGASRQSSSIKRRLSTITTAVPYGGLADAATSGGPLSPPSVLTERPRPVATEPLRNEDENDEEEMEPVSQNENDRLNTTLDDAGDLIKSAFDPHPTTTTLQHARQHSILDSKVPLPAHFEIPITSQDAESMHTLTFCAVLLAAELRDLLMAVEDSLQHRSM